jgi:hypothetical protein
MTPFSGADLVLRDRATSAFDKQMTRQKPGRSSATAKLDMRVTSSPRWWDLTWKKCMRFFHVDLKSWSLGEMGLHSPHAFLLQRARLSRGAAQPQANQRGDRRVARALLQGA